MKRYPIVILGCCVVLMFACRGNKTASNDDVSPTDSTTADTLATDTLEQLLTAEPLPKAADELFDDFIFNFASNRKLQAQRIAFPLKTTKNGKESRLERDGWKTEHFFMRQGYYTLLFDNVQQMNLVKDTSVNHAVVEKLFLRNSYVKQYVFDRIRGVWMLTSICEMPMAQNHNASFLQFYRQFACDSAFQAQSLNETVQFVGPDPDDDFQQMEGVITPDTWAAFAPQLPSRMLYNIVYGKPKPSASQKIFVLRGIANGLEIEMTFRREGSRWKLIKLIT